MSFFTNYTVYEIVLKPLIAPFISNSKLAQQLMCVHDTS